MPSPHEQTPHSSCYIMKGTCKAIRAQSALVTIANCRVEDERVKVAISPQQELGVGIVVQSHLVVDHHLLQSLVLALEQKEQKGTAYLASTLGGSRSADQSDSKYESKE